MCNIPTDPNTRHTYESGNNKSYLHYVMRDTSINVKHIIAKVEQQEFNNA